MRDVVLDASVVAKWVHPEGEQDLAAAERLYAEYESGELIVLTPALLRLELLNAAARRWAVADLDEFANRLLQLRFVVREPALTGIARWAARGLTAYDACYVALAEAQNTTVITTDRLMISVAGPLAVALA